MVMVKQPSLNLINGLLQLSSSIYIHGQLPFSFKSGLSYLPDTTYLNENMKIIDAIRYFSFIQILISNTNCSTICIAANQKNWTALKGNKEKVQLILVMSREADLYVLDEPIGGVDQQHVIAFCGPSFQSRRPNSSVFDFYSPDCGYWASWMKLMFHQPGRILLPKYDCFAWLWKIYRWNLRDVHVCRRVSCLLNY